MDVEDFSEAEKKVMVLAGWYSRSLTIQDIQKHEDTKMEKSEAEEIVTGLVAKGVAQKNEKKDPSEETVYKFYFGISGRDTLIDLEEEETQDLILRSRVCP